MSLVILAWHLLPLGFNRLQVLHRIVWYMYIDCRLVFGVMLKYYCKTKHLLFRIINIFLLNMLLWFKCLMKTSKSRLWRLQTHTPLNLLKTVLEGQLLSKMSVSIHNILFPKSGSHFLQKKIAEKINLLNYVPGWRILCQVLKIYLVLWTGIAD